MTPSVPRLLLTLLVALALLPAAAQADGTSAQVPVPASDAMAGAAHALAVSHWGVDPCGGQVSVTWAHMGPGINARSQWMSVDIRNPATYSQCSVTYNLDVDWDWPKLCTVIEHELGHLAGHDHVNDPHDVMSPYYVYPSPECAANAAPAATPAPVTTAEAPAGTAAQSKKKSTRRKVSKRKASTRSAKAKARSARAARSKESTAKRSPRGRARVASADSGDHALRFGCAIVSA